MAYIIIDEFGETYKAEKVGEDEYNACDSGILDVIDTDTMKKYYEGEWHDQDVWGET